MTSKKIIIIVLILCASAGIYYRHLLASAFARNPYPQSTESITRGKQIFASHCAACHGTSGRGDGPVAASLSDRMDDLSSLPPGPIFPDGVVVFRIANGKGLMPAWRGTLTEGEMWDVLNYIRALRPAVKS